MATNRIRIGKQTELSTTPRSIVITNATNEQEYVPPGADGTVLTVVAGVPTWQAVNALRNLSNIMGAVAITETPISGDTTTFRNGLHLAVVGTDNQVMWGGNLNKNTVIAQTPATGDGSPTAAGYSVTFDGDTGAAATTANPKFTVNMYKRDSSGGTSILFQQKRNSLWTAASRNNIFWCSADGTGLTGVNSFAAGGDSNCQMVILGSQYQNYGAAVTNTVGHEMQGTVIQMNWGNCANHVFSDICGLAIRAGGSASAGCTVPYRTDLYLMGTGTGIAGGGTITQSRKLVICSRDAESTNQANIQISDSANFTIAGNSRSNTALTGLWNIYSDTTRNSWIRGNTRLGGAAAAIPAFLLQLSTDSAAKPTTATWTIVSDRRTKKNIQKSTVNSLDVFEMLPELSTFEHNEKMDASGTAIGYMADELAALPFQTEVIKRKVIETVNESEQLIYESQTKKISDYKNSIEAKFRLKYKDDIEFDAALQKEIKVFMKGLKLIKAPAIISNEVDTVNYHELMMLSFDAIKQLSAKVKYLESKLS